MNGEPWRLANIRTAADAQRAREAVAKIAKVDLDALADAPRPPLTWIDFCELGKAAADMLGEDVDYKTLYDAYQQLRAGYGPAGVVVAMAWKHRDLVDDAQGLTGPLKAVLGALAKRLPADKKDKPVNDDPTCFPGITDICDVTGFSQATVKRATKQLEDLGLIESKARVSPSGDRMSNRYTVHLNAVRALIPPNGDTAPAPDQPIAHSDTTPYQSDTTPAHSDTTPAHSEPQKSSLNQSLNAGRESLSPDLTQVIAGHRERESFRRFMIRKGARSPEAVWKANSPAGRLADIHDWHRATYGRVLAHPDPARAHAAEQARQAQPAPDPPATVVLTAPPLPAGEPTMTRAEASAKIQADLANAKGKRTSNGSTRDV